ncbi:MAG: DUF3159 domain-containing protein, partial [Microterricola sp.]
MSENDRNGPDDGAPKEQSGTEQAPEVAATFGNQLADAARKAGLGKLADDEKLSPRDMLAALGG